MKKIGRAELDKLRQFRTAINEWEFEKACFVLKKSTAWKASFMVQMLANRLRHA